MKTPVLYLVVGAASLGLGLWLSGSFAKAPAPDATAAKEAIARADARADAAVAREKVWRDSAARAHNAGARSGAEFYKRDRVILAAPPVVLTDTEAVKVALAQRDSALAVARQAIADRDRELAARDSADKERAIREAAAGEREQALKTLNASIAAEIPTRRQQLAHDSKVVGFTLAAVGAAQLIFGR